MNSIILDQHPILVLQITSADPTETPYISIMADAESRAKLYLIVLKHTNTLDVNWKAFAEELGITLAGNA